MKLNENGTDRALRMLLGVALIASAFIWLGAIEGALVGTIAAAIGLILLLTGVVGFCPAYRMCGISTCRTAAPPPPAD